MRTIDSLSHLTIDPYDSFARAIFGVLNMPRLTEEAEKRQVDFLAMRDGVYDHVLAEGVRTNLQMLARTLSRPPTDQLQ